MIAFTAETAINRSPFGIDLKNPFTMSNIKPNSSQSKSRKLSLRPEQTLHREPPMHGGAYRDRTDDLKLAKLALSQLS